MTSGTDLAVSASVFASRSRDSSRTEESRSVNFTRLLEMLAVERIEVLLLQLLALLVQKIELEVEVKVGWLEATVDASGMVVCGCEHTVERQAWAGDMETTEKSVSSSEGILQIGWWAARMNSSRSFSFKRLAISFCRLDFSSSS